MTRKPKQMVVAGVMSGTSADGVDVAVVRVSPGRGGVSGIEVIGYKGFRYPKAVRVAVLRAASGEMKVADLSRLNWRLGELYAECVRKACAASLPALELVGMHGQTVYHQAVAVPFAGRAVRATWQIGEAAAVRERLGVPVVSDFRPADLAAGGQGAPLVPMLDYCLFRSGAGISGKVNRVLLNLGGIANMTVIPAGAGIEEVIAFDTGPANMVMDALMQSEFGKGFDRGGRTAARGTVMGAVVDVLRREKYFRRSAPKSCGREEFGAEFAERLCGLVKKTGGDGVDAVATAMGLTVATIINAYDKVSRERFGDAKTEVIAAGGGVKNEALMRALREVFEERGATLGTTEKLGVPAQAKEAVAFALLAWLSWHGLVGNVASATGARGGRVLGKISW